MRSVALITKIDGAGCIVIDNRAGFLRRNSYGLICILVPILLAGPKSIPSMSGPDVNAYPMRVSDFRTRGHGTGVIVRRSGMRCKMHCKDLFDILSVV